MGCRAAGGRTRLAGVGNELRLLHRAELSALGGARDRLRRLALAGAGRDAEALGLHAGVAGDRGPVGGRDLTELLVRDRALRAVAGAPHREVLVDLLVLLAEPALVGDRADVAVADRGRVRHALPVVAALLAHAPGLGEGALEQVRLPVQDVALDRDGLAAHAVLHVPLGVAREEAGVLVLRGGGGVGHHLLALVRQRAGGAVGQQRVPAEAGAADDQQGDEPAGQERRPAAAPVVHDDGRAPVAARRREVVVRVAGMAFHGLPPSGVLPERFEQAGEGARERRDDGRSCERPPLLLRGRGPDRARDFVFVRLRRLDVRPRFFGKRDLRRVLLGDLPGGGLERLQAREPELLQPFAFAFIAKIDGLGAPQRSKPLRPAPLP